MQELRESDRNIIVFGSYMDLGIWFDSFRRVEHAEIELSKVSRQIHMKSGASLLLVSGPNSVKETWEWKARLSGLAYNTVYFLPGLSQEAVQFGLSRLRGPGYLLARWFTSKEYERKE